MKRIDIGKHSYAIGGLNTVGYGNKTRLTIGKYCSIAEKVIFFLDSEHHHDWITTFPPKESIIGKAGINPVRYKGDTVIGNDVWIGYGSYIMSGISIHDGAVIGAGSIVTRDIPPYAIAAGNPARVIGYRFPHRVIARLLKIRWWDWDDDKVNMFKSLIWSDKAGQFIEEAEHA